MSQNRRESSEGDRPRPAEVVQRCLVVAHETAASSELQDALVAFGRRAPQVVFVLLVPATASHHLLLPQAGTAEEIAARQANAAEARLNSAGVRVKGAVVGSEDPVRAIAEELSKTEGYTSILIATHPARISRWIRDDVPGKAQVFGLPVMHLIVRSVAGEASDSAGSRLSRPT